MSQSPPQFDVGLAHRYFFAECFNRAWPLIEKPDRTPADDEQMLLVVHASLWHWTQREDGTPQNLSVGHWQLSRVYAVLGDAAKARHHGERSLELAKDSAAFYRAYAEEALARAALIAGDRRTLQTHLTAARDLAAEVADPEDRKLLDADLEQLMSQSIT